MFGFWTMNYLYAFNIKLSYLKKYNSMSRVIVYFRYQGLKFTSAKK